MVAVVSGEAGIGKSRLAAAVAVEVHQRGGRVVLGSCTDGPHGPYEPFTAMISEDVARLPDDELRRALGDGGDILARVCP